MRILVIEDSQVVSKLLKHMLKNALECTVDVAASLSEAAELLANGRYFVALTDLNLPDAPDGEVVKLVLSHQTPCIVLTGRLDDVQRKRLLQLGIVDYVLKENRFSYEYVVKLVARLGRNQHIKVLVADDSVVSRKFVRSLLEQHLFQVLEADDGLSALEALSSTKGIQLLITDYNMPGLDGFELILKVREQFSREDLAIIGLSSDNNETLTARFIKNGANDFLQKPFVHEEFHCRVINTLESLEMVRVLWEQANLDFLTALYSRRYYFATYQKKIPILRQKYTPLSVALLDIDFFKRVNDTYGHDVGDEVLVEFARRLNAAFGHNFTVARLGGEEFSVAYTGLASSKAYVLLDKFREQLAATPFLTSQGKINVSVSAGLAELKDDDIDTLLKRADEALYLAKDAGRNCVKLADVAAEN